MKSQQLKLHCILTPDQFESQTAKFIAPILPAYAIEYAELIVPPDLDSMHDTRLFIDQGFEIVGNEVHWHSYRQPLIGGHKAILIVHYHGIRDYKLLFPAVSSPVRIQRLANYYEEADKCFDSGSWLSFMMMCGAIFEGLIFDSIGSSSLNEFKSLVDKANENGLILDIEKNLIDKVRNYRNMIHLDNKESSYVSRADVMDTRKVLDNIVQRFSYDSETSS